MQIVIQKLFYKYYKETPSIIIILGVLFRPYLGSLITFKIGESLVILGEVILGAVCTS